MDKFIVQWHITHLCNLRCIHCYQEDYACHMSMENIDRVIEKLVKYREEINKPIQVNITGGEPMYHPNFLEILRKLKENGFIFAILTNGTLIDEKMSNELRELHPLFVQISLDGSEEIHDEVRGKGNFKRAIRGIDLLKEQGIRVLGSFTAHKHNYKDFENVVEVCKNHNVDKLWWDRVVTEDKSLYLSTKEFKWLVDKCNSLKKDYSFISNSRALQCIGTEGIGYKCSAGKNLLAILADGSVMPCRRLPFVVGNILKEEIDEINENETMIDLRSFAMPEKCWSCKECFRCYGGSKCVTYAQKGKWNCRDVNCFLSVWERLK